MNGISFDFEQNNVFYSGIQKSFVIWTTLKLWKSFASYDYLNYDMENQLKLIDILWSWIYSVESTLSDLLMEIRCKTYRFDFQNDLKVGFVTYILKL